MSHAKFQELTRQLLTRLWIEEESVGSSGLVPPPTPLESGEKAQGRYHSTEGKWLSSMGTVFMQ
eukprot:5765269-Amphidinium_carterae.1